MRCEAPTATAAGASRDEGPGAEEAEAARGKAPAATAAGASRD